MGRLTLTTLLIDFTANTSSWVGFPFRVATWAGLSAVTILNHFPQKETTEQWLKTYLTGLSRMLAFGAWCGECNLSQGLLTMEKVA
jgi:hypothetical protein